MQIICVCVPIAGCPVELEANYDRTLHSTEHAKSSIRIPFTLSHYTMLYMYMNLILLDYVYAGAGVFCGRFSIDSRKCKFSANRRNNVELDGRRRFCFVFFCIYIYIYIYSWEFTRLSIRSALEGELVVQFCQECQ